ncbi:MAG: hypothetical protein RBT03_08765 [Kiritimatiellia bacterium]|jgi:hypothetical protein|nr:hypothetical protein [Kiritimatiellia bacterium]
MNRITLPLFPWVVLPLCLVGAALAVAQAPTPDWQVGRPGKASMYSTDRRFMVAGLTSSENMVLASQLADWAAKIESATGQPLPMRRDQVLGVLVQSSSSPDTPLLKMQGWDGGHFYQRLVVPGRYRLNNEDMMEASSWLLLNRYAAEYTPPAQRAGMGATMPEWISAGLIQNTQAALRSRNRDWIARDLADGRRMSLSKIVRQDTLPPGRWREKAYAAAAVEFLFPAGAPPLWTTLFRAVGQRQPIDPAWLRQNCPVLAGQHPETAWQEHLAQHARTRTIEAWSDRGLQIEQQLLLVLNCRPRTLVEGVPEEVPENVFARDLVNYRQQDWVAPLAAALSLQMQSLRVGGPPGLQEVLASYAAFFDQLGKPPVEKTSWWRRKRRDSEDLRPPDDATWQVALNQLWQRAERAHQQFLERHQNRKRYVDAFDRPQSDDFDAPAPPLRDLPRTRWQAFVDQVEERLNPAGF